MGTLDLVSRRAEECKLKMSAMLFLLPLLLLCGVHSKHFLIETQDTDVQSEDLVNQQDGIRTELDGNTWKTKADGSKGKIKAGGSNWKTKADGSKGKKIGADYCWPWWMCPM